MSWPGAGAGGHPSRNDVMYPVTTEEEARRAVQDYVKNEARVRQDLGRRPRRQAEDADAAALSSDHRRGAESTTSPSPPTPSRWRMRRSCTKRASMGAITAGPRRRTARRRIDRDHQGSSRQERSADLVQRARQPRPPWARRRGTIRCCGRCCPRTGQEQQGDAIKSMTPEAVERARQELQGDGTTRRRR